MPLKKVAIHGSNGFARRWPESARALGYEPVIVDAYDPNIWQLLDGCDAFLWNLNHDDITDIEFARSILLAVAKRGLRVFPDHNTCWHFDDKVAQAYLLQAINAPLADTWTFFGKRVAQEFLGRASYPLVFKLRRGAGSLNVRLINNESEGRKIVRQMFAGGRRAHPPIEGVKRAVKRSITRKDHPDTLWQRGRRAARNWMKNFLVSHRESGYVLFQRFIDGNAHDTRVTVIGNRAFVYQRDTRDNDFRASGSGKNTYLDSQQIPQDMVKEAFKICSTINAQTMALDFIRDEKSKMPVLLEISFTFIPSFIARCPGYTDERMKWVAGSFQPEDLIMRDLMER